MTKPKTLPRACNYADKLSPVFKSFRRPLEDKSVIDFVCLFFFWGGGGSNKQMFSDKKYDTYSLPEKLDFVMTL